MHDDIYLPPMEKVIHELPIRDVTMYERMSAWIRQITEVGEIAHECQGVQIDHAGGGTGEQVPKEERANESCSPRRLGRCPICVPPWDACQPPLTGLSSQGPAALKGRPWASWARALAAHNRSTLN
jgi:hypothetical protein